MQNHYNLLYREEEREMIPACIDQGLGVIPWSPMARGRLARPRAVSEQRTTTRAEHDRYGQMLYENRVDWSVVDAVERIAKARGVSMAEVSLAWLLAKPGVTAPIVGATKLEQLQTSVRAVDLRLSDDELRDLESGYTPKPVAF